MKLKRIVDSTKKLDQAEAILFSQPQVECPVTHRFTPGLYIREIFIPAGTMLTSKIHKTEHQFMLIQGSLVTWSDVDKEMEMKAPFIGITQPGTRRIAFTHEDCIWVTIHPTDKLTPEEVEEDIIQKHDNPLLSEEVKIKYNLKHKKEDSLCHS